MQCIYRALGALILTFSSVHACAVPQGLVQSIEGAKNPKNIRARIRDLSPAECRLLKTIGTWQALDEKKRVTFEEVAAFYQANPNWPNQIALRRRAEEVIDDTTSKNVLRRWFSTYAPLTSNGLMWFARVMPLQQAKDAVRTLKNAFMKIALSEDDLVELKTLTHGVLTPTDYALRFDARMQANDDGGAKLLLPFLSSSYAGVARARLALSKGAQSGASGIARAAYTIPGYVWQYGVYLLKTQQDKRLQAFLKDPDVIRAEKQNSELWWTSIRRIFVRRLLEQGRPQDALSMALGTPATQGSAYSEALWLRGWIRLTFLNNPKQAQQDFNNLYALGREFVNLSKAAYWAARASKAADPKMRMLWLKRAAENRQDFYGQLALTELGHKISQKDFIVSAKESNAFNNMELVRVIRLLKKIGLPHMSNLFFWKLAMYLTRPDEHTLLIKLASQVGGAYPAVQVTKIGSKFVLPLMKEAYPQVEKSQMPNLTKAFGVNIQALVHAIIRQESRFDKKATSHRGAKGMMQVVDPTARDVSRKYGITYKDLYNTKDNIRLGQQYIQELLTRYNGSLILAIAAYNAGPGRVDQWVKKMGYPQTIGQSKHDGIHEMDVLEWIQMIPFRETRFYVEHVLENYWCYAVALDGIPIKNWMQALR